MAVRRLHEFVRALRGAGLRISPVEAEEASRAAVLVGYRDRDQFRETLALTLLKNQSERPHFDRCFDAFFRFEEAAEDEESAGDDEQHTGEQAALSPESLSTEEISAPAAELVAQSDTRLEQTLARAAAEIDFTAMRVITQQGLYARRLLINMGMGAVDDEILRLTASSRAGDMERGEALRQWRGRVREMALTHVRRQYELHGRAHGRALREHSMRAAPFRELREFQQVRVLVQRLARRLARSHQRRQKKARRGALDARRTLAASLRYNGVPVRVHWRRRRRTRAKVLVVCDVSSSVRDAARFLLQFLYAMTDVLPRVRSFAFAARFDEVTDDFERYAPDVAVGRILDRVSGSGTDYGTMFRQLETRCRGEIDSQTTVIILGDARNNDLPAGERHLADIARRARQVLWLNPEPPSRWNSGDAIMARYLPYCRAARRCGSLNDLSRFVDELLRGLD